MELFSAINVKKPLAEELRPLSLKSILLEDGHELLSLHKAWLRGKRGSFLIYGPTGSGKTSFIKTLYDSYQGRRELINAVDVGIAQLRETLKALEDHFRITGEPTLMLIDEAHRLKAPQQDILLPVLESGAVLLLAATTQNPSFKFNKAFLSRLKLIKLKPLSAKHMQILLDRGLEYLGFKGVLSYETKKALLTRAGGDGRRLLGDLSGVVDLFSSDSGQIDDVAASKYLEAEVFLGSKELRVNGLSALIKSMRACDEGAAVYYMGLLLKAKEDPEVLLRRMLIFASEDIGNANPQAVIFINSLWEGFLKVGMPEAVYSLYQGCAYLAKSSKSRRHVDQVNWADQVIDNNIEGTFFPKHLRKSF